MFKHFMTSNVAAPHGPHLQDRMHGLDERKEGIVPKNINDLVAKGSDLQRHRMVSLTLPTFMISHHQPKNINDFIAKSQDRDGIVAH